MERNGLSLFELLVIVCAVVVGVVGGVVWLGAWAAASISGTGRFHASFSDAVTAAIRLPGNLGHPARAWPPGAATSLPGPLLYWAVTVLVLLAAVALVAVVIRLLARSKVGTLPRRPLGVDARARFATARDLRPLAVRGPRPGRFLLVLRRRFRFVRTAALDG